MSSLLDNVITKSLSSLLSVSTCTSELRHSPGQVTQRMTHEMVLSSNSGIFTELVPIAVVFEGCA